MKRKTFLHLGLIFLAIFILKIVIIPFFYGPTQIPDEGCIIEIAKHFAQNLELKSCKELIKIPAGNPPPLIPIIFSIFYAIFTPIKAYKSIMVFHAFLTSSLVFPLYKIFKKFLKSDLKIFIGISLSVLIPQFFIYEKSVFSEIVFAVTNIWLLYFYIESFEKNKTRNKIISFGLSVLAIFMRPFGFIVPISLLINEFIQSKKKKTLALMAIPTIVILWGFIYLIYPQTIDAFYLKFANLGSLANMKGIVALSKATLNQFNSLSIATLSVLLIIFLANLDKKTPKIFQKIKYYLLTFIVLNFLIATQHLFEYHIKWGNIPALSLRYINLSIIFITIFGLIFLLKNKEFKIDKKNTIISAIILIPILFLSESYNKLHFIYEYIHIHLYFKTFFTSFYIFIAITLVILLFLNKRKVLVTCIATILLANTTLAAITNSQFSFTPIETNIQYQRFKDEKLNILYVTSTENIPPTSMFWGIKLLTENTVDLAFFLPQEEKITGNGDIPQLYEFTDGTLSKTQPDFKKYDNLLINQ